MSETQTICNFKVEDMEGNVYELSKFLGSVLLIVNVASKCGLADKSYKELANLLAAFSDKGLKILLFPCNQFANQEYKTNEEIKAFASKYSEQFILMAPVKVKGDQVHPLFKYLSNVLTGFLTNDVKWNFTYFLIDRKGVPVKRYSPSPLKSVSADDKHILKCINEDIK